MKRPAFTLVELLLAVSITVAIAVLTTTIFGGMAKLQADRRSSQSLVSGLRQALDSITEDTGHVLTNEVAILTGPMLVTHVPSRTDAGYSSGLSEWHVYCVAASRLHRFVVSSNGSLALLASSTAPCSTAVSGLFSGVVTAVDDQIITEPQTAVTSFTLQDAVPTVVGAQPMTDRAVRVVLTGRIDPRLQDPTLGSDLVSNPVTLRTTIVRRQP